MDRFRHRPGSLLRRVRPHHLVVPSASLLVVCALALLFLPGGATQSQASAPSATPEHVAAVGTATPRPSAAARGTAAETPAPTSTPAATPVPPSELTGYVWPLPRGRVTLPFGPTEWGDFRVDGQLFHDGVDMATFCGDTVYAAHGGMVLAASRHFDDFIGWQGDLAPYYKRLDDKHAWLDLPILIVIDDGNGYRSMYAHLNDTKVSVGQTVKAGQLIGHEGATGRASGCHLHYGLFSPLDPGVFLLDPGVAARMQLPYGETARINPLLVLPYRNEVEEMRTLRPEDAARWTPSPSPVATPSPATTPKPAKTAKP